MATRRLAGLGCVTTPSEEPGPDIDERNSKTKTAKSRCTPAAPMFPVFLTNH